MKIKAWLNLMLFSLALAGSAQASQVTIGWADSPSAQVAAYRVYSSATSGSYHIGADFIREIATGTNTATIDVPYPVGSTVYLVITALDSAGLESAPSNEVVKIADGTVTPPANQPPVLAPIGPKTTLAGQGLFFTIAATDPDGDAIVYSATNLPAGATLDAATGGFEWTPGLTQMGSYSITLFANDAEAGDSETIAITVTSSPNHQPTLVPIGDKEVAVNELLSFILKGTDPDDDPLLFSGENLPAGSSLDASSGQFSWTPGALQVGTHVTTFTVSDAEASESRTITITVNAAPNQPPVLVAIGDRAVTAGESLAFTLSATDPDGDALVFSATTLPAGSTLSAAGQFSWIPDVLQVRVHVVTFSVSDGAIADSESVALTVNAPPNQPPVLAPIGDRAVTAGENLAFTLSATDPDVDALVFSATTLPAGSTLSAAGQFSWIPDVLQVRVHVVTFFVSDGAITDSESVALTVNAPPNQPPVLAAIGDRAVTAGQPLAFTLSASDDDNDPLTFSVESLPSGASLDAISGEFSWTPSAAQAGNYTLAFSVSDGQESDSATVAITVEDPPNQPPVLSVLEPQAALPEALLTFTLSATDGDGDELVFSCANLPAGAALDAVSGAFTWTPTLSQVGVYLLDFVVDDATDTDGITVEIGVDEMTTALDDSGNPVDVISGDLTGDAKTDLVVLDGETNEVLVYEGNGKGRFNLLRKDAITGRPVTGKTKKNKNASTSEFIVLTEDFSVTGLSRSVEELALNDGGIYLVSATPPAAALPDGENFAPTDLDIGDLDGDGLVDAVVTRLGTNDVAVLFRSLDKGFTEVYSIQTGLAPISVVLKDFDLDGFEDMAVASSQGYGVSIYLGSPSGDFTYIEEIAAGNSPGHIVSDDFDLDGIPDLAIPDKVDGTLMICLGNGDGTFLTLHYHMVDYAPFIIEASDLNNDQIIDLAVLSADDGYVHLLYGQGDGYFTNGGRLKAGETPVSLLLEDFDGDAIPEVAVSDPGLGQVVLMRTSQAEAPPEEPETPPLPTTTPSAGGGGCFLDTLLK